MKNFAHYAELNLSINAKRRYMSKPTAHQSITELKNLLENEPQLDKIGEYFFTNIAENPNCRSIGKIANHSLLKKSVNLICQQFFKEKVLVTGFLISVIKKYRFYHSPFNIEDRPYPGLVFYFDDIDKGMIILPCETKTDYFRFSFSMVRNKCILVNSRGGLN
jgi:hypothetical protein